MIDRCRNPHPDLETFQNYAERGITVCDRWRIFANFLEDMGEKPSPQLTIERINNDDGYYKENCYWGTRKQQNRNNRHNVVLTVHGITGCFVELCERFGVNQTKSYGRLRLGWPLERIFPLRMLSNGQLSFPGI